MTSLTANGNSYTDGLSTPGILGMADGGSRANFLPMCNDVMAQMQIFLNMAGASLASTSSDDLTLADTGSITFTLDTEAAYAVGTRLRIANDATHWMEGIVTAYNRETLSITVSLDLNVGTGNFTSWSTSLSGARGPQGETGGLDMPFTYNANTNTIDSSTALLKIGAYDAGLHIFPTGAGLQEMNLDQYRHFRLNLTGAATLGILGTLPAGVISEFTLTLVQDATGGHSITFPPSISWIGDPPNLKPDPNTFDVLAFRSDDGGTTWKGWLVRGDSQ